MQTEFISARLVEMLLIYLDASPKWITDVVQGKPDGEHEMARLCATLRETDRYDAQQVQYFLHNLAACLFYMKSPYFGSFQDELAKAGYRYELHEVQPLSFDTRHVSRVPRIAKLSGAEDSVP